jgi:hypothetical protein
VLFEELNNNGGHIVVGLVLILLGATMVKMSIAEGHEIIGCGSTIIARSMYDTYRATSKTPAAADRKPPSATGTAAAAADDPAVATDVDPNPGGGNAG